MDRKSQVEKLVERRPILDPEAIMISEPNPTLEGDEMPEIDDGKLPGEAVELAAIRDDILPGRKQIG